MIGSSPLGVWRDFKPIPGLRGRKWHFKVWYGVRPRFYVLVFFWDEEKGETGCVEIRNESEIGSFKQKMLKVAKQREYRRRFLRPLKFPLERYYP